MDYNTFVGNMLSLIVKGSNKPIFRVLETRKYCAEPAISRFLEHLLNFGIQRSTSFVNATK